MNNSPKSHCMFAHMNSHVHAVKILRVMFFKTVKSIYSMISGQRAQPSYAFATYMSMDFFPRMSSIVRAYSDIIDDPAMPKLLSCNIAKICE